MCTVEAFSCLSLICLSVPQENQNHFQKSNQKLEHLLLSSPFCFPQYPHRRCYDHARQQNDMDLPASNSEIWQHPLAAYRPEWCSDLPTPCFVVQCITPWVYCIAQCPSPLSLSSFPSIAVFSGSKCQSWKKVNRCFEMRGWSPASGDLFPFSLESSFRSCHRIVLLTHQRKYRS